MMPRHGACKERMFYASVDNKSQQVAFLEAITTAAIDKDDCIYWVKQWL